MIRSIRHKGLTLVQISFSPAANLDSMRRVLNPDRAFLNVENRAKSRSGREFGPCGRVSSFPAQFGQHMQRIET